MAETAKILAPEKTVLVPDANAGCSLADTITADQLRAWKAEHPGAVVVSYVNTSAEVKAETDVCCTSSNAVEVVESDPGRPRGAVPPRPVPRRARPAGHRPARTCASGWASATCTPASPPPTCGPSVEAAPDAELLVHPECGCATSALWMVSDGQLPTERVHVLSTGGMLEEAKRTTAKRVLVATEIGMLHQLRQANPVTDFQPVNSRAACPYMKMSTPEKLLRALREGRDEVTVDPAIAARARAAVEAMVAIGTPSPVGE